MSTSLIKGQIKQQIKHSNSTVTVNPWQCLRGFTDARIAMGRSGSALPTSELLKFQWDHACARDAVHQQLDCDQLVDQLQQTTGLQCLKLHSQAESRDIYLQRPDLGRQLNQRSISMLEAYQEMAAQSYDLAIVIADGLSSAAVQNHSSELVRHLVQALLDTELKLAPLSVISQGRVASGDQVAEAFACKMLVVIIGERPGLSSPDSLGIYYTYSPVTGTLDAARNCISNVRPAGLSIADAVKKLLWLIEASECLGLSGVELKEAAPQQAEPLQEGSNFLLPDE